MTDDDVINLQKKANYFFRNGIGVHIKLKRGAWQNGHIQEVSADFFLLSEFKEGDIVVFFSDVLNIEKYTQVIRDDRK